MRTRLVLSMIGLFMVVGLVLAIVLLGPDLLFNKGEVQAQSSSQQVPSGDNPIVRENAQPGTTSWQIPPGKVATIEIQAYAGATSISQGHNITFYVSTETSGAPYYIAIYRLGWYNGMGGRLMAPIVEETGQAQGYYGSVLQLGIAHYQLINCPTCSVDPQTHLVQANWQPSYTLSIPTDWTSGVYLAKFTVNGGKQTYVPFDVTGSSNSKLVAVTPDTTSEAYNDWGGYSLYVNDNDRTQGVNDSPTPTTSTSALQRAVKVSFDRPYAQNGGSGQLLVDEIDAIRWLERMGYDVSYISNVDLQNNPGQLLNHAAYLSLGHDEYWTKEMRDGVENARDHGVGLAFLGANAAYWQMRFEPNSQGVTNRTIVCYKVTASNLARDPMYGVDNSRVTAKWRDPILNRPENALVGIMFSDVSLRVPGFPWVVNPKANSPLLSGTGLQPGKQYGCTLVGDEWDRVFNNGATPAGLTVIATSATENDQSLADVSNTTYYIAKSGAMVFATGSVYWDNALDNYRLNFNNLCQGQDHAVPEMQKLLQNVLQQLVQLHPTGQLTTTTTTASTAFSAFVLPFPLLGIALFSAESMLRYRRRRCAEVSRISRISRTPSIPGN